MEARVNCQLMFTCQQTSKATLQDCPLQHFLRDNARVAFADQLASTQEQKESMQGFQRNGPVVNGPVPQTTHCKDALCSTSRLATRAWGIHHAGLAHAHVLSGPEIMKSWSSVAHAMGCED